MNRTFIIMIFLNVLFPAHCLLEINKNILKSYISKNPIVVEAGAHKGWDTIEFSKMWPAGKIYAIEPVPAVFKFLVALTRDCKNVSCFQIALGSSNGEADMFVSSGDYGLAELNGISADASSSLLAPKEHLNLYEKITFQEVIKVPTFTFDTFIKQQNITIIDLLWLDLQGYEAHVLMASPRALNCIKAIYTEVNEIEMYEGCIKYPEYRAWLEAHDFVVVWEGSLCKGQRNVLFVKKG